MSVASVWELAMKASAGRLRLARPFDVVVRDALDIHRYELLPLDMPHVLRVMSLPTLHGDPFDRMIVAQAIEERCTLVTRDRTLQAYPVEHVW